MHRNLRASSPQVALPAARLVAPSVQLVHAGLGVADVPPGENVPAAQREHVLPP